MKPWATGSSHTIRGDHQATPVNGTENDHSKPLPPLPPPPPQNGPQGSAPEYLAESSWHVKPTDDKQELQRRRLEMERSAPPTDQEDDGASAPPLLHRLPSSHLAPSAPTLNDDDEDLVDAVRPGRSRADRAEDGRRESEALPEYRR